MQIGLKDMSTMYHGVVRCLDQNARENYPKFLIDGFNALTALTVATVAFAILKASSVALLFGFILFEVRNCFLKGVQEEIQNPIPNLQFLDFVVCLRRP